MSIAAGDLDRLVTIRKRAGVDAAGQPLDTWVNVAVGVWANIGGQTGKGAIFRPQADVPAAVKRYSVRVRYRTDVMEGMQVLEHGADGLPDEASAMRIVLVQMDKARRQWTDLVCEVGGNNG